MSSKEFAGKVVLITGASTGIGAETAIQFSNLGARLALTGRSLENLKKTQQKCPNAPEILLIPADLTNENDVKEIVEKTIQKFGILDVLVNNAALIIRGNLENSKLEDFDKIHNTNVRAVYQLTQLALPYLKAAKGNIVNVSSLAGIRSFPDTLSFCMSKTAVVQFTKCISLELAPHQVRVNCVCPGIIKTDTFKTVGMNEKQIEVFLEARAKSTPLERVGNPEEIANTITFLASERAGFITGAIIPVGGGSHSVCAR